MKMVHSMDIIVRNLQDCGCTGKQIDCLDYLVYQMKKKAIGKNKKIIFYYNK